MKKLVMTFAIVAFLFGGLSINANAQNKGELKGNTLENTQVKAKDENKGSKEVTKDVTIQNQDGKKTTAASQNAGKDVAKEVNYDKMLKDYEAAVNKYISTYEKDLKAGTLDKSNYKVYLDKALELQAVLEKAKLNKQQTAEFGRIKTMLTNALKRK